MVDYSFYTGEYFGVAIPIEVWPAAEREASALLAKYKREYTVTAPAQSIDAESMAVCAMAEVIYDRAVKLSAVASSASIGSISTSYSALPGVEYSEKQHARNVYNAARQYLDIYRGCG